MRTSCPRKIKKKIEKETSWGNKKELEESTCKTFRYDKYMILHPFILNKNVE